MNNLFYIILFLGLISCPNCFAIDTNIIDPVHDVADKDSALTTTIINNNMRQQQATLDQIGGFFNSSGVLAPAAGGTGVNLAVNGNKTILIWDATNVGIGTLNPGTTGQIMTSNGPGVSSTFQTYTPPTQIANYNTTSPTTPVYEDDSDTGLVAANAIAFRTSVFSRAGTVNTSFTAKALNGAATGTAYVRKNGVQIGTTRSLTNVYQTFSEDIAVSSGDYLDVFFSVCTNNCEGLTFIVSEGNPAMEKAIKTDGSARLSPIWKFGLGSPSTNGIACNIGDLYSRLDGAAATTLYVCTSASTWTAK